MSAQWADHCFYTSFTMKIFLSLFIMTIGLLNGQEFSEYRLRYDQFGENDPRAIPHLRDYIAHAKKEGNYRELFQAYKDAVHFIPHRKLAYSDSSIWAANQTRDRVLIATSYLTKGTVYYFTYRKFQPALDEYLKAWKYSKDSPHSYLYYKNLYHIGVIKSYLGYYGEALAIFEKCRMYFGDSEDVSEAANLRYNRKKGYLNALYQEAHCLAELSRTGEAEQLTDEGLRESIAQSDFYLERSYFLKLKGVLAYHRKDVSLAIHTLDTALLGFEKKNDFTHAAVIYYYQGKNQVMNGQEDDAVMNFAKVDSVFSKYGFLLPEVRGGYEFLIDYYRKKRNRELEHYYTLQLLKVDHILSNDFKYLSGKIHKEYDTEDLLASKNRLEHSVSRLYTVIWTVVVLIALIAAMAFYPAANRKWFLALFQKKNSLKSELSKKPSDPAQKVPDAVVRLVLEKLTVLENNRFFLERGMTLQKLAPMLNTNTYYLSIIIKEYRGDPYNVYLKELRVHYAAQMLRESKQWRSMTLEHLAHACGFIDRTNFSVAFYEYHQLKPLEFIQRIKENQSEGS